MNRTNRFQSFDGFHDRNVSELRIKLKDTNFVRTVFSISISVFYESTHTYYTIVVGFLKTSFEIYEIISSMSLINGLIKIKPSL